MKAKTEKLNIPNATTHKAIMDARSGKGMTEVKSSKELIKKITGQSKTNPKLTKAEQEYEDKVDRNLLKRMQNMSAADRKLVSRESVMKILKGK